jgi:PEP-CTERM motif-containing protein
MRRMHATLLQTFQILSERQMMRHARGRLIVAGAAAFLVSSAGVVRADPFIITSGQFSTSDNGAGINVLGPGFSIGNADSNPEEPGVGGLAIGRTNPSAKAFPVSGHIRPNFSGRLSIAGAPDFFGTLQFDFRFTGNAAPAVPVEREPGSCFVPCSEIAATGPFRLSGELNASNGFHTTLTGGGIATVGFVLLDFEGEPPHPFASFAFSPVAPTPEPTTLVLLALGAGIIWRTRRSESLEYGNLLYSARAVAHVFKRSERRAGV